MCDRGPIFHGGGPLGRGVGGVGVPSRTVFPEICVKKNFAGTMFQSRLFRAPILRDFARFARRRAEEDVVVTILLILWVLGPGGEFERGEVGGFADMGACKAAAVSLTEPSPVDGWSPVLVARCEEVMR